jgi:hypothetical protein
VKLVPAHECRRARKQAPARRHLGLRVNGAEAKVETKERRALHSLSAWLVLPPPEAERSSARTVFQERLRGLRSSCLMANPAYTLNAERAGWELSENVVTLWQSTMATRRCFPRSGNCSDACMPR